MRTGRKCRPIKTPAHARCANPTVLECPIYRQLNLPEEIKNEALWRRQARSLRRGNSRGGFVVGRTHCVFPGFARCAGLTADRSRRAVAEQTETKNCAAANSGNSAGRRGREVDARTHRAAGGLWHSQLTFF